MTIQQLHYKEQGRGLPVVLIHGFPLDHRIWAPQLDALAGEFRVITPDLRGHGQSPVPDGIYHMEALAADIVALLDGLDIARAVWVGHSMGGYLVMAALRTVPERIAAVGLVATHPYPDSDERRAGRRRTAEMVLQDGPAALIAEMTGVLFSPTLPQDSPVVHTATGIMAQAAPLGIAGALRGMALRADSVETLHDLDVPALVVAGAGDLLIPSEVIKQMVLEMPNTTSLEIIEHAGHIPMLEQPAAATAILRTFLRSLGEF